MQWRAEIGTGAGVGTAWMASAMPADCRLITAESHPQLAVAVAQLMAADHRIDVLAGDARDLLYAKGPFDLLFADGGCLDPAFLRGMLRVGGDWLWTERR
jgi:predicted O-methyltransferase YrrM